jgi:amidophosphoribosyltransferase
MKRTVPPFKSTYDGWQAKAGDDAIRDACGVCGIFAPGEDVARSTFFALYSLQHRGQESAGIAVSDGQTLRCHKDMGLISQIFTEEMLESLPGHLSVGHTRYSTTGSSIVYNAQPLMTHTEIGQFALAHKASSRSRTTAISSTLKHCATSSTIHSCQHRTPTRRSWRASSRRRPMAPWKSASKPL